MSKPLIYGHRGFSARYPENTLLAFRKAIESGADGVECDVQQTRDGDFVILHDDTVDRTSQGKGAVSSFSLTELKALDFGQGERIPTLKELLEAVPRSKLVNIEVKQETVNSAACQRLAGEILSLRGTDGVLVSSFDHELLPIFKRAGFRVAMLLGEEHQGLGPLGLLKRVIQIRPHALNLPVQAFEKIGASKTRLIIHMFKLLGFELNFWTVNTREHFDLIARDGGAVITDEVEAALGWLKV